MKKAPVIRVKRVYDAPADTDGFRVLVDRLWPRGLSKARACVDLWLREVAPSTALRQWFQHDPTRFSAFRQRYWQELEQNQAAVATLIKVVQEHPVVTLLYGARDEKYNQAQVLRDYLVERVGRRK